MAGAPVICDSSQPHFPQPLRILLRPYAPQDHHQALAVGLVEAGDQRQQIVAVALSLLPPTNPDALSHASYCHFHICREFHRSAFSPAGNKVQQNSPLDARRTLCYTEDELHMTARIRSGGCIPHANRESGARPEQPPLLYVTTGTPVRRTACHWSPRSEKASSARKTRRHKPGDLPYPPRFYTFWA